MERWANYFLASAGGSAALTGLVFVAVSLNLQKILSFKQLPDRALGSLILLVNIFTVSLFSLITVQSIQFLGIEILLLGIFIWLVLTKKDVMNYRRIEATYRSRHLWIIVFSQSALLPFLIAGILLLSGSETGIYFLIPGITLSFFKSLLDAWVLLVEINR
jgi:modulator of FtsH protease